MDLIEREGDAAGRLQVFVPPGVYLQPGIKMTIDQGTPIQIPYVMCFSNLCVAGNVANPELVHGLESGQTLSLEAVNSNVLSVVTSLPLDEFAKVHRSVPTQVFEQSLE